MLGEFLLRQRLHSALAVEQQGPRTGGALIERKDVIRHGSMFLILDDGQLANSYVPAQPQQVTVMPWTCARRPIGGT
jgi:hypothetical protein